MAKRNEKGSLLLLVASAAVIVLLATQVKPVVAADYTAAMETAVRGVVNSKAVAPGLIRLLFHDCFVRGCDGSVLLESTPTNVAGTTEKDSGKNDFLRGLDLIQKIRDAIFNVPGNVNISCADAIVFAAREATFLLSNIVYNVDGPGRLDGVISSNQDAEKFLPGATDNFEQLKGNFGAKGFTVTDLVALSATHSVGVCHKPSFKDRFVKDLSNSTLHQIDPKYQKVIVDESAPLNDNVAVKNNLRDMKASDVRSSGFKDKAVNMKAVGVLDNSYYNFNLKNMVRFKSDWELRNDTTGFAETKMNTYLKHDLWMADFKAAMTKLSNTLKSEGTVFEDGFRKDCTRTNLNAYPPPAP